MRVRELRHELARSGLMEGKTPWVVVATGQDHLPHVFVVQSSKRYEAIENLLVSRLRDIPDLPPGTNIVISEADDVTPYGRCQGITVATDPPSLLQRVVHILDVLVLQYAGAIETNDPRVTKQVPGYAYYQTSLEV